MGKVSQRSAFRLGTSALSLVGALIASSSLALADDHHNNNPPPPPPPVTAFDDIGIGYLNGPDPDANRAEISFETSVSNGNRRRKVRMQVMVMVDPRWLETAG